MPDRYVDAVRSRRGELREQRGRLLGGHRTELRSCLALSRLAARGESDTAFAALRREAIGHVDRGDRAVRAQLPDRLGTAVAELAAAVTARWAAAVAPPLRRIATERGLVMAVGWPRLPAAPGAPLGLPAELPGPSRSLLSGLDGATVWRLGLAPVAALSLLGLGGPAFAPLAVAAGGAAVVGSVRTRRTAVRRARLQRLVDDLLATAAAAVAADLDRRVVELEGSAGAALDAAVLRHRDDLDRELQRLAARRVDGADRAG